MDWLYYQVFIDRYADTQVVLSAVAAECGGPSAPPWFYLRYLDATGLHLRLRWTGEAAELDRTADTFEAFLAPDGPGADLPIRDFGVALYEPELGKWGGAQGLRMAERVFAVSTASCLALLRDGGWTARPIAAAAAMRTAVALLPAESRTAFLRQYAWYWTSGPGGGRLPDPLAAAGTGAAPGGGIAAVRARAAELAPRLSGAVTGLLGSPALNSYREALAAQLAVASDPEIARAPTHLLFHQIHLTNNRLGIAPHQEAVLAEALVAADGADPAPPAGPGNRETPGWGERA